AHGHNIAHRATPTGDLANLQSLSADALDHPDGCLFDDVTAAVVVESVPGIHEFFANTAEAEAVVEAASSTIVAPHFEIDRVASLIPRPIEDVADKGGADTLVSPGPPYL